jgi:hypothetical protein
MATFFKFGKLWEIPPAAARLGASFPANTKAFETLLTDLEPMLSNFIRAHPRCPANPDLPAIRYAIKEFMEEGGTISSPLKEHWAASYDPARKVTYVSWFLSTIVYFLDKVDFTTLDPPPVEPMTLVFIAGQPRAPIDPRPQSARRLALHRPHQRPNRSASPGSGMAVPHPRSFLRNAGTRGDTHS